MRAARRARTQLTARLAVYAALLLAPRGASAASPQDKAAAETLFREGRALLEAGRFGEACPKLAESYRLDPTTGGLMNLARCHEGEGKTASAWAEYRAVVERAKKEGFPERVAVAERLAAALEPTLAKLELRPPPEAPPGLVVTRDGSELRRAALGVEIAVDPGSHFIEARAPGHTPWSQRVRVEPRGRVRVAIPTLSVLAPTPGPVRDELGARLRAGGLVVTGVGVAGLAVGLTLGGLAAADYGRAAGEPSLCPQKVCTPAGRALVTDGDTKAAAAQWTIGVGATVAAAGLLVLVAGAARPGPARGAKASRGAQATQAALEALTGGVTF